MIINNISFDKNHINQNNKYTAKRDINFTSNKLVHTFILEPKMYEKVSVISEVYDKIMEVFTRLNGIYQRRFKSLYPNLIAGERIKGLVLDSLEGLNGKRLQVTRYNLQKDVDELLSFGIMDNENRSLVRYKVLKDKKVLGFYNPDNNPKVAFNPFQKLTNIDYEKYLSIFLKELENLKLYSENFRTISRKSKSYETDVAIKSALLDFRALGKSSGMKQDVDEIVENYKMLTETLAKIRKEDATKIKKDYLGEAYVPKTKGLTFYDLMGDKKFHNFLPISSLEDNRACRLIVYDRNKEIENIFVFFSDGRVAKQTGLSVKADDIRPNNLKYISDEEIEKYNIKDIFKALNRKFADFEEFIAESRNAKSRARQKRAEEKSALKFQQKQEAKAQRALLKEQKTEQKASEKAQKALERAERKAVRQTEKEQSRLIRLEQRKAEKEARRLEKLKQKPDRKPTLRVPKPVVAKPAKTTLKPIEKIARPQTTGDIPKYVYDQMALTRVLEGLDDIFDTPVEARSSHLIHERLSSGRVFGGKFIMNASDGAKVTVTRMRLQRFLDFIYYAIKVEKNGETFVMNLDPSAEKILRTSKEGKIEFNDRNFAKHISKDEFIEANPQAINLPKYMEELFEVRQGEQKVIKSKMKIKKSETEFARREQEVLKALHDLPDIDDLF